jgi:cysteine desulfurase
MKGVNMIYLDYAANTPACEEVIQGFVECEHRFPMNPNSNNPLAKPAKEMLDDAKNRLARVLKIKPNEMIFTSSGTESNNLAIKGIAAEHGARKKHIITSFLEHSSTLGPIGELQKQGYEIDYVQLDTKGKIDFKHLQSLLREDTLLVALCEVDSEVGILQDIHMLSKYIKEHSDALVHIDGTQAVGKVPIHLEYVDSYTFSGHKIYGLNGIACLVLKESVIIEPLHHGGLSISPYRSGTPSLSLIDSLATALSLLETKREENYTYVESLRNELIDFFENYNQIRINSTQASIPFITNITLIDIKAEEMKNQLAEKGFFLSTKSACSSPYAPSRAVYALTKDKKGARSTLRISLSHLTTRDELDAFKEIFDKELRNFNHE